ncbi:hypothetical protein UPYG_G00160040 [Umbra pygmaea]|uniref:Uncharacterized protein n=1 Tax=Umbra pygmaea TaxID=75934 RepID=A0ABD0X3J0_UMBPY
MQREDKPSLLLSFHTEPKQETLDSDCDSGAQFSLVDSEMTSVKLEDCSQTLGLDVIIKDEEEEEKIGDVITHGAGYNQNVKRTFAVYEQQREDKPSLMLSFHTEPKQETLDSDCDSGAQCSLVDSEMTSVKPEDCSQTLGLNVIIKDEEEKIGDVIDHAGIPEVKTFTTSGEDKDKKSQKCRLQPKFNRYAAVSVTQT